jgi:hypothetical protein
MDFSNLDHGDVIFFSTEEGSRLEVGMYLESTIVSLGSPTVAIMGPRVLTCMSDDAMSNASLIHRFSCSNKPLAAQASKKMCSWLMQRLPHDISRENTEKDYSDLNQAQTLFESQGFFNVVKFSIRDVSHNSLTRQTLENRGKGLRMTHLILLAFQIPSIQECINPSTSWFSYKEQRYKSRCLEEYITLDLTQLQEKLPSALQVSGKFLNVDMLLQHFLKYSDFWQNVCMASSKNACISLA